MSEELLVHCLDEYASILGKKRFAVAVSGGCDSLCLLMVAKIWAEKNGADILALTVDHGLRRESSGEALYVHRLCEKYGISHRALVWTGEKPLNNLESKAREARYGLMSNFCRENSVDCLLVAHHREDQAETFFLRLFRGSGIDGLSSMQKVTHMFGLKILRPFLNVHKSRLKQYLLARRIDWVEDPSNDDQRFLRNRVRRFLNGFENKEEITNRIGFALEEINKLKNGIDERVRNAQNRYLDFSSFGTCLLRREIFLAEDRDIVLRVLASVAMRIGGKIYKPRLVKLERLLRHLTVETNHMPRYTFYGCVFENFGNEFIMIYREYNSLSADVELILGREILWDNRFRVLMLEDIGKAFVTHIREGELKTIVRKAKARNSPYYKDLGELRGIEKRVFYSLPIVMVDNAYLIDCKQVQVNMV